MPLFPALPDALDEIADLVNRAYRGTEGWTHEGEYIDGQRTDPHTLRADLAAAPKAELLTLRDTADGPLLGVVWLEPTDKDVWYLGMLTVRPDIQDRQLGRGLLAEAEAHVKRGGGRRVRMTVVSLREPLIAWYVRRGYVLTGETEPFPYENQTLGAPRRDDLAFVVLEKGI